MGSKLAIMLIALIWIVVIVTPVMARRRESQAVSSVGRFNKQLIVLGQQCTSESFASRFDAETPMNSQSGRLRSKKLSARTFKRRQRAVSLLALITVGSLLPYPLLGSIALVGTVLCFAALSCYLALLAAITHGVTLYRRESYPPSVPAQSSRAPASAHRLSA